jgi:hypothetical protein
MASPLRRLPARAAPARTCRAAASQKPAEPSSASPAAADKLCQLNSDCQSGACEDGRCGEAKYCASRFFYDQFGTDIQLRTFGGEKATLGHHQQPIKCGQCVCKDCPVSGRLRWMQAARLLGACPSTHPLRSASHGATPNSRPWARGNGCSRLPFCAQLFTTYFMVALCEWAVQPWQPLPLQAVRFWPASTCQHSASTLVPRLPAAGLCNSTTNQAILAQLEADLTAQGATAVTLFCVDTPDAGRRLLASTQAIVSGSACGTVKNLDLPLGQQTGESVGGCVPALPEVSVPIARGAEGAWKHACQLVQGSPGGRSLTRPLRARGAPARQRRMRLPQRAQRPATARRQAGARAGGHPWPPGR